MITDCLNFDDIEIPEKISKKLLEYQIPHVKNLMYSIDTYGRVLDASDTGTGKTYAAIATCMALRLKPLIVCPKSVINSWKRVMKDYGCKYYGLTNYESFQNLKMYTRISQKESVKCMWLKKTKEVTKKEKKNKKDKKKKDKNKKDKKDDENEEEDEIKYYYEWINPPDDIIVIFDEAHRCKNSKTLSNLILKSIADTNTKIILLSATIADKEKNFALAGYTLKLYKDIKNCMNWIRQVGSDYSNPMMGVHKQLIPEYMCRMRIKDLKDVFPDNQILADCQDMDCAKEIEEQYALIQQEVEHLKNKEDESCALAAITYARMRIEQLKIPTFIEMTKKFLKENNSVVIFVNFTMTLKTLASELKTNCLIFGEQSIEERNKNIDDFNNDKSQIIIVNIRSGGAGISLHDTNGVYPRISIISPSWSAQDILQALGRIHRANCKTPVRQRIVFCKNTVEEAICKNMIEKIRTISSINEGVDNNYKIEGLLDDNYDQKEELTEFEITFLKINTLYARKARLESELCDTDKQIKDIEQSLGTMIN